MPQAGRAAWRKHGHHKLLCAPPHPTSCTRARAHTHSHTHTHTPRSQVVRLLWSLACLRTTAAQPLPPSSFLDQCESALTFLRPGEQAPAASSSRGGGSSSSGGSRSRGGGGGGGERVTPGDIVDALWALSALGRPLPAPRWQHCMARLANRWALQMQMRRVWVLPVLNSPPLPCLPLPALSWSLPAPRWQLSPCWQHGCTAVPLAATPGPRRSMGTYAEQVALQGRAASE